jgi:hypothetical protein
MISPTLERRERKTAYMALFFAWISGICVGFLVTGFLFSHRILTF